MAESVTNFSGRKISNLLAAMGFKPFGPGHSARNGYELWVSDKRRACFYDNRIWGYHDIEFTVMSYERVPEYRTNWLGFKVQKGTTPRYGIYTEVFKNENDVDGDVVKRLIEVAKTCP